ncbi:hypothetical protein SAY87_028405 [Trapa incisa]|uniref:Uncharacterized protein n=1 Tax=Trapa incisa TaxID=236973 RepID=A0AAN7QPY3_9MYRT|nr:hypothetical protein SAY87_028405 [Trapa incisa]
MEGGQQQTPFFRNYYPLRFLRQQYRLSIFLLLFVPAVSLLPRANHRRFSTTEKPSRIAYSTSSPSAQSVCRTTSGSYGAPTPASPTDSNKG